LMMLLVWIAMTVVALRNGLQGGVMVFNLGNLITNALLLGAVMVLRRLERGFDPMLDYNGYREMTKAASQQTRSDDSPAHDNNGMPVAI